MKKLLIPAVLALVASTLTTAPSFAHGCCANGYSYHKAYGWAWLHWLHKHHCCSGCCLPPYNAFSPPCCPTFNNNCCEMGAPIMMGCQDFSCGDATCMAPATDGALTAPADCIATTAPAAAVPAPQPAVQPVGYPAYGYYGTPGWYGYGQ